MSQTVTRQHYSEEEITRGLHELALCNGSARLAARRLADDGLEIPFTTLHKWKQHTHAARYLQVVKDELPKVYERVAERNERIAERHIDAEHAALDRFFETAGEMKPGEASTAARNFAVAKGVAIDKASVIRGRPTEIKENRHLTHLLRALAARFPSVVDLTKEQAVDSTATEVDGTPAQLPSSTNVGSATDVGDGTSQRT